MSCRRYKIAIINSSAKINYLFTLYSFLVHTLFCREALICNVGYQTQLKLGGYIQFRRVSYRTLLRSARHCPLSNNTIVIVTEKESRQMPRKSGRNCRCLHNVDDVFIIGDQCGQATKNQFRKSLDFMDSLSLKAKLNNLTQLGIHGKGPWFVLNR